LLFVTHPSGTSRDESTSRPPENEAPELAGSPADFAQASIIHASTHFAGGGGNAEISSTGGALDADGATVGAEAAVVDVGEAVGAAVVGAAACGDEEQPTTTSGSSQERERMRPRVSHHARPGANEVASAHLPGLGDARTICT
jgi:hypothetical protein